MSTYSVRKPRLRLGASLTFLLHLSLAGLVPAMEGAHAHDYRTGTEWHTSGSHEHGDEHPGECPLLQAASTLGIVGGEPGALAPAPTIASDGHFTPSLLRAAEPPARVVARGPPAV